MEYETPHSSPDSLYSAATVQPLDNTTLDYHSTEVLPDYDTIEVIGPLTSHEASETVIVPADYRAATHSAEPDILDGAIPINLEPLNVDSLTPSYQTPHEKDNDETLLNDSNAIYCQCCSGIMSATHTCPNENDTPLPLHPISFHLTLAPQMWIPHLSLNARILSY